MRKPFTGTPRRVKSRLAAKGKFCGSSPAGSSASFFRLSRAFGPQTPMQPSWSVRSSTKADHSRSEEHTFELQSLMRISYAVFCLKKKTKHISNHTTDL